MVSAHVQIVSGPLKLQIPENLPVHAVAVVLTGMQDEIIDPLLFTEPDDRGHLDDFRASPEDYCDFWVL